MKLKLKAVCFLLAIASASSAQAYQVQKESPLVLNGQKENSIKGLNVDKFPVKDVTNQIYAQNGIRLGGAMISTWVDLLRQAGYDVAAYNTGLSACQGKLAGRRYILDYGNATSQVHIYDYGKADLKNSPATNPATNIQNFALGSQVNLTGLFCQVYGYEFLAQSIQIQHGSVAAYAPLCEVLQGNSCGLANDKTVSAIAEQSKLLHPCVPGAPGC